MKSTLLKILKFCVFLSIGVLLLYFAFKGIDLENIKEDFRNARYNWVLLSLVFALLAFVSRAIRWNILIEPLNYKPRLTNTFYSLMMGYLANFAFPRLGEVTRCASLAKKEKIPVDKLFGTVIVERVIDLFSLLILLVILIIFRFEKFGAFFSEIIFIPLGEKITNTLEFSTFVWLGLIGIFIAIPALYLIFREKLSNLKIIRKIKDIIKGIIEGLKTVYKMKKRGAFIFHSLFIWANYWAMTWVVVFALPTTAHLGIMDGLFLLVIGGLAMAAPVQGGIGAYHWIVSRGLLNVYDGIGLEDGLVFATLSHGSQAILIIILGTISFLMLIRRKKALN
ncbi:MAG: flippase-like domain-containing protein [Bacteroidales bacterium]|nr:flippase-like domain-containing protein [Bacteroidales bacterium]